MHKELTKAEEQVMQAIWKVGQGFANEIVTAVEGGAAYNTVLTVVRILEQKGYVAHETFNRSIHAAAAERFRAALLRLVGEGAGELPGR